MLKTKTYLIISTLILGFSSCTNNEGADLAKASQEKSVSVDADNDKEEEKNTITLTKIESFATFPDAKLNITKPASQNLDAGENQFQFNVENYSLREQTKDADSMGLANSAKGQHVHFILNNGPYAAKYDEVFMKDLPVGDHVMLAFLSRSYHMAVKNEHSYVLEKLRVGEPSEEQKMEVDFAAPHLFYSRPKGSYSGEDTKKILLDFFLINTDLSDTGNKVLATINGEEFTISEWAPFAIEGLPMGESIITLELIDKDGNFIEGPFNKVERAINLR
jgi:hypothetical protein